MDAQSVKNTEEGYVRGKRFLESRASPCADRTLGWRLHSIGNVGRDLVNVLADGGDTASLLRGVCEKTLAPRLKLPNVMNDIPSLCCQNVGGVERSFAWIGKCRRLWKNCERKLNTSLQFMGSGLFGIVVTEILSRF